ncbi:hypothetical protein BN2476_830036 [Paraburkholderia piptadeniae]|uniref:Uncharacterized protein n=1 Tax=Paraburkholderia piptadeniae TaxID=1701573 RepID=A0A1N7SSM1_9BURK|nr:hypothetical protein [Paraburkholderia piptadeniae]SIT50465.1 hypothetical protein BN2476_830036 [Paraburkholderia piptadeniae]
MALRQWAEDAADSIDAGFFSGDTFNDREALDRIEWYIARWQRQIVNIKAMLAESEM